MTATYWIQAIGAAARRTADLICTDQTVETAAEIIPDGPIRGELIGRVESIEAVDEGQSSATISFPLELFGRTAAEALHVLFGTCSLKPGIRLVGLEFPLQAVIPFSGARYGRPGLRTLTHTPTRPMVCAVLKPLGLTPDALASLAREFALGGVDWIKDDQGMSDHVFCRFQDRVRACAEAVAEANRLSGGTCRYVAHVSGPPTEVRKRARIAKDAGAGGLLICPGLTGYDVMRELAEDETISLPIFSHPALLGTYALHSPQGIAPAVLYGTFPRLFGADVTIYPTWGPDFGLGRDDCASIAAATATSVLRLPAIFPTAAGRIGFEQIDAVRSLYGQDVVYVLGSRIQHAPDGIRRASQRFIEAITPAP